MLNLDIYANLLVQFEKVFKHNRQGSYKTKQRYAEAFKRFLAFLAEHYRLERIANIAPKHVAAYVAHLEENWRSPAYIKTELSAIRFFHDQIPNARHKLPDNATLNLQRRQFGQTDRTWSGREFNLFVAKAMELGREDYAAIFCLARYTALRLHECFRIDTQIAAKAVKTGIIVIKGKGGLIREVPINLGIIIEFQKLLAVTPRGHKLFVAPDDKTHLAMQRFEEFIQRHKPDIQDMDSKRPMTFHGLRHTCAAEWYKQYIDSGNSEHQARKKVAYLLGHGRDGVTKIYLASLREDGDVDGCVGSYSKSGMLDEIIASGGITDVHLRMLVDKVLVGEADGKLEVEICLKAAFMQHYDVYNEFMERIESYGEIPYVLEKNRLVAGVVALG
jgi:integrase